MSAFICPELLCNRMVLRGYALKPGWSPRGGKVGTDLGSRATAQRYGEGTAVRGSIRHKRMEE